VARGSPVSAVRPARPLRLSLERAWVGQRGPVFRGLLDRQTFGPTRVARRALAFVSCRSVGGATFGEDPIMRASRRSATTTRALATGAYGYRVARCSTWAFAFIGLVSSLLGGCAFDWSVTPTQPSLDGSSDARRAPGSDATSRADVTHVDAGRPDARAADAGRDAEVPPTDAMFEHDAVEAAAALCAASSACPVGQACDLSTGMCSTSCAGGLTCNSGCCDGTSCQAGTAPMACGTSGACAHCSRGCDAGICTCGSYSDCNLGQTCNQANQCTSTCNGGELCNFTCCDLTTHQCVSGETVPAHCGMPLTECKVCSGSTSSCDGGTCVP
jgi:hypothetical protein